MIEAFGWAIVGLLIAFVGGIMLAGAIAIIGMIVTVLTGIFKK